jgi:hypothetical protein
MTVGKPLDVADAFGSAASHQRRTAMKRRTTHLEVRRGMKPSQEATLKEHENE